MIDSLGYIILNMIYMRCLYVLFLKKLLLYSIQSNSKTIHIFI